MCEWAQLVFPVTFLAFVVQIQKSVLCHCSIINIVTSKRDTDQREALQILSYTVSKLWGIIYINL